MKINKEITDLVQNRQKKKKGKSNPFPTRYHDRIIQSSRQLKIQNTEKVNGVKMSLLFFNKIFLTSISCCRLFYKNVPHQSRSYKRSFYLVTGTSDVAIKVNINCPSHKKLRIRIIDIAVFNFSELIRVCMHWINLDQPICIDQKLSIQNNFE